MTLREQLAANEKEILEAVAKVVGADAELQGVTELVAVGSAVGATNQAAQMFQWVMGALQLDEVTKEGGVCRPATLHSRAGMPRFCHSRRSSDSRRLLRRRRPAGHQRRTPQAKRKRGRLRKRQRWCDRQQLLRRWRQQRQHKGEALELERPG